MAFTTDVSILLRDQGIKDVWLVGYVEGGTRSREFHPMFWWVYVEFHTAFLRLQAVNEWHIKFEIVKSIGVDFDVDPNDEFGTMSVGSLFLPTVPNESYKVKRFDALTDDASNVEAGIIKCGGFIFEGGESMFFDPSNILGFRIGSETQVREWTALLHFPITAYTVVSIFDETSANE